MTDEDDTVDVRDAYDVGETTVSCVAKAHVPDVPLSFLGDDSVDKEDWEPDHITGYVKGVGGHYHVHFPTQFYGTTGPSDPHDLVALSVRESLHGPSSFTGLYVRSDADNYLLRRFIDGDHKTKGETTDDSIGEFLNDRDVVWVDDDAIEGVEPPNEPDVDVGDRVDYYAGDTGDPDDAIVYDLRDEDDDLYIDVLRPRDGELSKVSRVPPKTPHMEHGYMPVDDGGEGE